LFLRKRGFLNLQKGGKPPKIPGAVAYRGNLFQKKFTGKEPDPETGLYYYGARYLDPKTSRWLSGDPALGEYFPSAPVNDEAKERNQNLPGMGGVFNAVNMHAYHYAGNNPVKYTDPDGRIIETVWDVASLAAGVASLADNIAKGDVEGIITDSIGITVDALAVAVPGVPGGVGMAIKATRAAKSSKIAEKAARIGKGKYIPAPKEIPGISGLKRAKEKTPVQGGGGMRKRWKDDKGNIYEWDSQEGHIEKYTRHGKHQGAFDPNSGEQIKPADPKRKVEP
jgi:RHS repeat-associated protein